MAEKRPGQSTKFLSNDESGSRHGFGAKTSFPLTLSTLAVSYKTINIYIYIYIYKR